MKNNYTCHFCNLCNGTGCIDELPGLGGFGANINFKLNCAGWDDLAEKKDVVKALAKAKKEGLLMTEKLPKVRIAPITGAIENIGWEDEEPYYFKMVQAAIHAGIRLSIGDGCPDSKLKYGIRAVAEAQKKAAVFIKPYSNNGILERMEWASDIAEIFGIDIDSYAIVTMRNKVKLEKKTAQHLLELKKHSKVPFAIKGIFTQEDVDLVREVKPDIVYVSNHGGRVENRIGSTADFLRVYHKELLNSCEQLWVDGGIRKLRDIQIASLYNVSEVLVARPFITALCRDEQNGIFDAYAKMLQ
ncbi:MAG TPA: alpha-hydroxy-acid oxidizing protein [Treponemataceae bacterium]|nr:alpha-hydroxy-acid oxidizing protein [Treponemataceae bacterium]